MWAESLKMPKRVYCYHKRTFINWQGEARLILAQSAFERGFYSEATRHAKEALDFLGYQDSTLEAKVCSS